MKILEALQSSNTSPPGVLFRNIEFYLDKRLINTGEYIFILATDHSDWDEFILPSEYYKIEDFEPLMGE